MNYQTRTRSIDLCWSTISSIFQTLWSIHVIFLEPICIYLVHPSVAWNHEPFTLSERLLHLNVMAFYSQKLIVHTFYQEKKPHDHYILIVHHITVVVLAVFSYVVQCNGLGITLLFLHISTDVFLYPTRFLATILPVLSNNGVKVNPIFYMLVYVLFPSFVMIWYVQNCHCCKQLPSY